MLDPALYVHGIPGLDEALPIDVYAELSDLTADAVFKLVKARCLVGVEHDGEWYVEAPSFGEDELRAIWRRRGEGSEKSQKQSQKSNDAPSGGNGKKQAKNRVTDLDRKFAKILGLNGQVTKSDIKKKWRELSRQYHPDKVQHLGPKLRVVAEQEMKLINEAYEHFRDRACQKVCVWVTEMKGKKNDRDKEEKCGRDDRRDVGGIRDEPGSGSWRGRDLGDAQEAAC